MARLQHVLHNALNSWISPLGTFEQDIQKIREGKHRIEEMEELWPLIQRFAREVGMKGMKGSALVYKYPNGAEILVKLVSDGKCAFARLKYHRFSSGAKTASINVL